MGWDNIIGHEKTKEIFQHAILSNKLAGAYLITGIAGIGKDALAIEFAKTAMCETPIIENDTKISACGHCKSCKNMAHLAHVNFDFIFALPTGTTTDTKNDDPFDKLTASVIDEIKEQIAIKAQNPYHRIQIPSANQIRISQIRFVKRKLSMTTNSEGHRFVIISNADEMAAEAANAFLKTLEEPSQNTTIVLTSSRGDTILQTIHSRCQHITCNPLPDDLIISELFKREGISDVQARIAATFAQGSYSKALDTLQEDTSELRETALNMLRTSMKKGTYREELMKYIEALEKHDKADMLLVMNFLLFWMRDVAVLANDRNEDKLINVDQLEVMRNFVKAFGKADINLAVKAIEDSINMIPRNVSVKLCFISLFIKLRQVFLNRED
ncbi:MAG: hypothetical protein WCR42_02180 [bacterium]